MKPIGIAIIVLGLVACGGGSKGGEDFVGMYTMTSHHENHGQGVYVPCSDPGPSIPMTSTLYAPYFSLIVDPFANDPDFILFQTCTSPDPATCTDSLITLSPGGPGLEDLSANTQTGGGTTCNLYAGQADATLSDGGVLTFEDRAWDSFNRPAADCTLENAEALRDTADCRDVVQWIGTAL